MACVVTTGNIDDVLNKAYETLNFSGTDIAVVPEDIYAWLHSHTPGNGYTLQEMNKHPPA